MLVGCGLALGGGLRLCGLPIRQAGVVQVTAVDATGLVGAVAIVVAVSLAATLHPR